MGTPAIYPSHGVLLGLVAPLCSGQGPPLHLAPRSCTHTFSTVTSPEKLLNEHLLRDKLMEQPRSQTVGL